MADSGISCEAPMSVHEDPSFEPCHFQLPQLPLASQIHSIASTVRAVPKSNCTQQPLAEPLVANQYEVKLPSTQSEIGGSLTVMPLVVIVIEDVRLPVSQTVAAGESAAPELLNSPSRV